VVKQPGFVTDGSAVDRIIREALRMMN